jgi:glycosyltransferase involved in cell wall biosynthesis
VSVIYNGIDASKFYYDTTKRHDKFIVVHIGSFTYPKNHKLLIKIFHEFYLTNSNARLRLVGDGALLDDIKKQVRTCGLEEVVEFCGAVVDVPNCISGGSVFLFPSLFEGFGKAVIEAMSMGIVPIISDYPAAHEIIEHKKHGYIVKDQDVSRYVRYLTRLSQDEELHTTMAQMCRNRVNNKFTMKKMIEEYYDA